MRPVALNTAAAMATPKTAPKRCSVLFAPDALPRSPGATAPSAAAGVVGNAIEMPTPATTSGSTSVGQEAPVVAVSATSPSHRPEGAFPPPSAAAARLDQTAHPPRAR